MQVKELSTTDDLKTIQFLKKNVSPESIKVHHSDWFNDDRLESKIEPLEAVPLQQEGNRKGYLIKNVLDKYYSHDEMKQNAFFGSGSDWRSATTSGFRCIVCAYECDDTCMRVLECFCDNISHLGTKIWF